MGRDNHVSITEILLEICSNERKRSHPNEIGDVIMAVLIKIIGDDGSDEYRAATIISYNEGNMLVTFDRENAYED